MDIDIDMGMDMDLEELERVLQTRPELSMWELVADETHERVIADMLDQERAAARAERRRGQDDLQVRLGGRGGEGGDDDDDPLRTAEIQIIDGTQKEEKMMGTTGNPPLSPPEGRFVRLSPAAHPPAAQTHLRTLYSDPLETGGEWMEGFQLEPEVREALRAPLRFTTPEPVTPDQGNDPVLCQLHSGKTPTEHSSYVGAALKRRAALLYRSRRLKA